MMRTRLCSGIDQTRADGIESDVLFLVLYCIFGDGHQKRGLGDRIRCMEDDLALFNHVDVTETGVKRNDLGGTCSTK